MKLAKSILFGAAALGMAAGSALALDDSMSAGRGMSEPYLVYEETYVIADPSFDGQVAWNDSPSSVTYHVYDVDDDMDGRPDRRMILEQSDTLALMESDADLVYPLG